MSWKQTAQYSFADALLVEHKSLSKLDDVHEIIDWKQIEPRSNEIVMCMAVADGGRPIPRVGSGPITD